MTRELTVTDSTYRIDPSLERLATLMDDQFNIGGFRFGLNLIIDFIPEFGDIISTAIGSYIIIKAIQYRVSGFTIFRMLINLGIFFLVGLIPFLGDFFGAWWKPNRRNLDLLRADIKTAR